MFSLWTSITEFEARLEATEKELLKLARRYTTRSADSLELTTFDTYIPRSAVSCLKPAKTSEDEELKIHSIRAVSKESVNNASPNATTTMPLVNLHGYMNAGAYFYRNLGGLSSYFQNVYAVDMLGWGLSSRPPFDEVIASETIESADNFFVESLEAWRSMNDIDKMILSGHSFGGYVAVAYAERYPERVDRIILLSPLGVPDENDPNIQRKLEWMRSSCRGKTFMGIFKTMFKCTTLGGFVRTLTEYRGSTMARNYVGRRLPEITAVDEAEALSNLLYINAALPPSGEYFLQSIIHSSFLAKKPLLFRVPNLKVKAVSFMYGTTDWMDISGGMYAQALSDRLSKNEQGSAVSSASPITPDVNVFLVPNAGHLLILQNPETVNACMIRIAGGSVTDVEMATLMELNETEELHESWLEQTRKIGAEKINFGRRYFDKIV